MANEMRDRLLELIFQGDEKCSEQDCRDCKHHGNEFCGFEHIANYLIENGVVVPPCKVGETVYYIHETYWDKNYKDYIDTKELKEDVVQIVECPELKTNLMLEVKEFDWDLFNNWLNGEIFLTKAEAEQKLKEMRGV